jgi:hypothetical protein
MAALSLAGLAASGLALSLAGPVWDHRPLFFAAWAAGFLCLAVFVRSAATAWTPARALALLFGLGALLRLAFLGCFPADSDVWRYLWEGGVQLAGYNPYVLPPAAPELAHLARGGLAAARAGLNHPEWTAIYPPLAQLLFRAAAWAWPDPLAFKALAAALDLAGAACLAGVLARRGLHPARLALWLLNPLVLVYGAGEGHLDAILAFALCLGLWCFASGREGRGFLALGCAALIKWTALPLLPLLLHRGNWRRAWPALVPALAFPPFLDAGAGIFASLVRFGREAHHNDSLAALLRPLAGEAAPLAAAGLLAGMLALAFVLEPDRLRGAFLAACCVLLCLPVLYPWYLMLATPLLVLFPSRAWLWLHAAVAAMYLFWGVPHLEQGGALALLPRLAEYLPFFGLLAWALWRGGSLLAPCFAAPRSLAVVIPVRDEAANLPGCLESVGRAGAVAEVVVADGGSGDGSGDLARRLGARVVESLPGRGVQIAAGVAATQADVVLVLHADCRLAPGAGERVLAALAAHPDAAGGAFAMRFSGAGPGLVAGLNSLRARLTGISFGDQAQFFRREALERTGGYPAMALMEDVELCLRLKAAGRLLLLPPGVAASDRRWRGRGFARAFAQVVLLFGRYLLERRLGLADPTGRRYFQAYYGRDPGTRA